MAWSWGKKGNSGGQSWSVEHSSSKKRKIELESDQQVRRQETAAADEWGDAEEFTLDELEELDHVATQAMSQSVVSKPAQAILKQQRSISFAVPSNKPCSLVSRSTSSSSDSSIAPHSSSSRSSAETTTTSLSSHSSNGKLDPTREVIQTLQAKLDEERKHAQEEKYQYTGENMTLRDKLHKQEEALEKLRSQRDERYEQQLQAQSQQISKLQSQLDSLTSQAHFKEKDYQNLQEMNNYLQQKLKRFEQQPHASGDLSDMQFSSSPKPASPRKVSVRPSPPSKEKQKQMKESGGSERNIFPTTDTFKEKETFLQTVSASTTPSTKPVPSSVSCQTASIMYPTKPSKCRRLLINTGSANASGSVTGPHLVRRLSQISDREATLELGKMTERISWDPGLLSLLHDMSASLRIADLTYTREKDSSFLTPFRHRKHRQNIRSSNMSSKHGTVQAVSRQNLLLAIEGIRMLLDEDNGRTDSEKRITEYPSATGSRKKRTDTVSDNSKTHNRVSSETSGSSHDVGAQMPVETAVHYIGAQSKTNNFHHSRAVMLLPLLTDYIQSYVDLVQTSSARGESHFTPAQSSGPSPASVDSSSSYTTSISSGDSSFDSLSSHLGQLLQEGRIYASNIEGYAITALRSLVILIRHCPVVGSSIIANYSHMTISSVVRFGATTPSSSTSNEAEQQSKKSSSSAEADDEHSTSSSEIRVIVDAQNQTLSSSSGQHVPNSSSLLHLILRLASQSLEDGQANLDVVRLALSVLTYLSKCCTEEQIIKLETVITRGILINCFRQTKFMSVHIWAQQLLVSLSRSEKLLAALCTKSENCPLYLLHRAHIMKADGTIDLCREYMKTLASIMSEHRSGLRFLMSNACPCSNELVAAVVTTLYKLFCTYKNNKSQPEAQAMLNCLAQGAILLHSLARAGAAFTERIKAVRLQYVRTLSSLLFIMRSDKETWQFHLSPLEELCDFEPDSSETSQESDTEDKMEQS